MRVAFSEYILRLVGNARHLCQGWETVKMLLWVHSLCIRVHIFTSCISWWAVLPALHHFIAVQLCPPLQQPIAPHLLPHCHSIDCWLAPSTPHHLMVGQLSLPMLHCLSLPWPFHVPSLCVRQKKHFPDHCLFPHVAILLSVSSHMRFDAEQNSDVFHWYCSLHSSSLLGLECVLEQSYW